MGEAVTTGREGVDAERHGHGYRLAEGEGRMREGGREKVRA